MRHVLPFNLYLILHQFRCLIDNAIQDSKELKLITCTYVVKIAS